MTNTAVIGSFVAFVPVAWWLGRRLPQPLLHGVLMGAFAAVVRRNRRIACSRWVVVHSRGD